MAGNAQKMQASLDKAEMLTEQITVRGSWVPAGAGTTAPTGVRGVGFTVVQTADGVFDLSFTSKYRELISFQATAQVAGETTDVFAQAGDPQAASATVVEKMRVRTMTGGTPTSIHADAAPRVHFWACFRVS